MSGIELFDIAEPRARFLLRENVAKQALHALISTLGISFSLHDEVPKFVARIWNAVELDLQAYNRLDDIIVALHKDIVTTGIRHFVHLHPDQGFPGSEQTSIHEPRSGIAIRVSTIFRAPESWILQIEYMGWK